MAEAQIETVATHPEPDQAPEAPETATRGRKKRGVDDTPEQVFMDSEGPERLIRQVSTITKDDEGLVQAWAIINDQSKVMWDGKPKNITDAVKWIRSQCQLPADMTTADIRAKELQLGNILTMISVQLSLGAHERDAIAERKKDFLALAKDRRKTQAIIEAELVQFNEEYRYIRGIWLSAELNYKFWDRMHDMVTYTLDRLKQVSITLSVEARVDPLMNQGVPNRRGEKI